LKISCAGVEQNQQNVQPFVLEESFGLGHVNRQEGHVHRRKTHNEFAVAWRYVKERYAEEDRHKRNGRPDVFHFGSPFYGTIHVTLIAFDHKQQASLWAVGFNLQT
jgi:hypothetical protein